MKKITFYWLDGQVEEVIAESASVGFARLGYSEDTHRPLERFTVEELRTDDKELRNVKD